MRGARHESGAVWNMAEESPEKIDHLGGFDRTLVEPEVEVADGDTRDRRERVTS